MGSTSDGAYTAQTSVCVPAEVLIRKLIMFLASIILTFDMETPMDFLARIVTPLILENVPKMWYLLNICFWDFRHFFRPISSSLLSTIIWMSLLILHIVLNLRSDFFPFGHNDLMLVMARLNSEIVFFLFDMVNDCVVIRLKM